MPTSEEDNAPSSSEGGGGRPKPIYRVPWENLKLYFSEAIPRKPVYGHPGFNRVPRDLPASRTIELSVIPEARRKLRQVFMLAPNSPLPDIVTSFCELHLPGQLIPDGDTLGKFGRYMGLHAPSFDILRMDVKRPKYLCDMMIFVLEPLWVVERAITMVWPDRAWDHTCELLSEDSQAYPETYGDVMRCRCIVYRKVGEKEYNVMEEPEEEFLGPCEDMEVDEFALPKVEQENEEDRYFDPSDKRVVIMTVPPWKFTPADFELFRHVILPVVDFSRKRVVEYTEHQKLWMKLWDECAGRQSPFFVLTTHEFWLFGVFTDGWTRSILSDVYARDVKNPTIVQLLFYWFASALKIPGSWSPMIEQSTRSTHPDIRQPNLIKGKLPEDEGLGQEEWAQKYVKNSVANTADFLHDKGQLFEAPPEHPNSWVYCFNDEDPGNYEDFS